MATIPLLPGPSMDNVHDASHAVFQPRPTAGGGMQPSERVRAIVDMDLDSDGTLSSRPGVTAVRTLTAGRRLWSKGGMLLSQDGGTLNLEDPTTGTARALATGCGPLVAHEWPTGGDRVWLDDGVDHICVQGGVAVSWGLPVAPEPTVTKISGALPEASYLIVATFRTGSLSDASAQEGGARAPLRYTLSAPCGLRVRVPVADPQATHVSFYCSRPDQPEPMLAGVVAVVLGAAMLDLIDEAQLHWSEVPLLTQDWGPPPAGITALGSVQAHLLAGVGRALYRSWAGRPGLFRYGREVQMFPADITTIVGLQDGAYVGTTAGLYWLSGDSATSWRLALPDAAPVLSEGAAVPGAIFPTLQTEAQIALFVTARGWVAGLPGGQARHLTQDVYHFPAAARVSIAWHQGALRQVFAAVT